MGTSSCAHLRIAQSDQPAKITILRGSGKPLSQACSGECWSITEPEPTRGPTTHADTGMSFHMTDGQEVVRNPRPVNGGPLGVFEGS